MQSKLCFQVRIVIFIFSKKNMKIACFHDFFTQKSIFVNLLHVKCQFLNFRGRAYFMTSQSVVYRWCLTPGARSRISTPFHDFFHENFQNGCPKTNFSHFYFQSKSSAYFYAYFHTFSDLCVYTHSCTLLLTSPSPSCAKWLIHFLNTRSFSAHPP